MAFVPNAHLAGRVEQYEITHNDFNQRVRRENSAAYPRVIKHERGECDRQGPADRLAAAHVAESSQDLSSRVAP